MDFPGMMHHGGSPRLPCSELHGLLRGAKESPVPAPVPQHCHCGCSGRDRSASVGTPHAHGMKDGTVQCHRTEGAGAPLPRSCWSHSAVSTDVLCFCLFEYIFLCVAGEQYQTAPNTISIRRGGCCGFRETRFKNAGNEARISRNTPGKAPLFSTPEKRPPRHAVAPCSRGPPALRRGSGAAPRPCPALSAMALQGQRAEPHGSAARVLFTVKRTTK